MVSSKMKGVKKMFKKVSVTRVAELLGKSPDFIRWGLQEGKFPFGTAVRTHHGEMIRYNYLIIPKLLSEYTGIPEDEL